MNKALPTKIEQLAAEIYYAQSKMVDISVDDWIEKLKNLSKGGKVITVKCDYNEREYDVRIKEKSEKIEEIRIPTPSDYWGEDKGFRETEIREKLNEIITRLNNL